jgi:HlyD family secretion protein
MKKKIFIIVIIICVLGAGFYFFMGRNRAETAGSKPTMVNLAELSPEDITTKVSADGNIKTKNQKDIKVKLNGLVAELYIEEGLIIEKGQKILKIEEENYNRTLENAKLTLKESEKNYDDLKNTYNSQAELNELKLEEARRNLKIAILSRDKEKIGLENQKHKLEENLKQTQRNLKTLKDDLVDKKHLYENEAIPKNELEIATEEYNIVEEKYKSLEHEYDMLIKKTIPNALELAQLKVDNAQNSLDLIKANINRERITENDLEVANIKVIKAKREIKNINSKLEKLVITAPISGTILEVKIKKGDKVTEGSTIGKIANINELLVEVMVDEIDVNNVNKAQEVNITSDSFDKTLKGEVKSIAPISTKVGNINKYKTKIELKNHEGLLRPGMFVNAEIITDHKKDVLTVPSMAVLGEEDKYVFVAKDGKAEKRTVKVGLKSLSKYEISGVEQGEKVIIGPFTTLKDLKDGANITSEETGDNK